MEKPKLEITPKNRRNRRSDNRRKAHEAAAAGATGTVKIKAMVAIAGMDYGALRGGVISVPKAEAERLVAAGHAIYSGTPLELALDMLRERGCGVALPAQPDGEVQAAAVSVGITVVDLP